MLIDGDDGMRIVTEHTGVHLHGGVSAAGVRKRRRLLVAEAAAKTTATPSSLVSDMVNNPELGFEKNTIPTTTQISAKRSLFI